MWSHLRRQKEKLNPKKKVFRLNEKNWNVMNLNKGISFDLKTMKFYELTLNEGVFWIDLMITYEKNNYINKLKEYKLDSRIELFEETINYIMKKKQEKKPTKIQNIHFLSIHENEEML
jgi:hypothetical protein